MNIGERIKSKRTELGYTLEEIAKIVGVSRQTIQRYEGGIINNIPSDKIELLAFALHTTPAYLMGWEKIDLQLFGKEADDETYSKFAKNIELHHGKTKQLLDIYEQLSAENKDRTINYSKKLLSLQSMDEELAAAHERTDIEVTAEMKKHDDDIMDDDNF